MQHRKSPPRAGFFVVRVESLRPIADPVSPMTASHIPDDVRRFLLGAIPSVPHLEALLLVRAEPGEPWTAARLARRLYVDENGAARLLRDLDDAGLLQPSGNGHRFEPVDAALAAVVADLDAIYARHVVEVAELIHSSSDRKAQRFADAFRLRKEP